MNPVLLLTEGPQKGIYLELPDKKPFWLGRDNRSDFVIRKESRVSTHHCYFLREDTQLVLVDDSSNGTQLNGYKVHHSKVALKNADIIRVGKFHFQVIAQEGPETVAKNLHKCLEDLKKQEDIPGSLKIPKKIGPYRIIELIGTGAKSKVFKAIYQKEDECKLVALKLFFDIEELGPSFWKSFYRETELLKALKHDAIIKILEQGEFQEGGEKLNYIALEYYQGTNLRDYIYSHKALPWQKVCHLLWQILTGLEYMHSLGIVHRDIKPGNLMYDELQNQVKIIDLGLGKSLNQKQRQILYTTLSSSSMGTPNFMPVEQWRDAKIVDERADIYSLGATIYFLLTGVMPYEECNDLHQIFLSLTQQKLIPLEIVLTSDVPRDLIRIVKSMMAFEAKERYPSCEAVLAKLKKLNKKFKLEITS